MNSQLQRSDAELDDAIRASLHDIVESNHGPAPAPVASSARRSDGRVGRQVIAIAATVVLVVAGLGLIVVLQRDQPMAANDTGAAEPTASLPAISPAAADLNAGGFADPASTVFGKLVEPLLPAGFELVFALDDPEPLIVALNANGDRFESVIYSSDERLAEVDRVRDELQLEVPEGVLAVGPHGEPGETNAYLVTSDAIVTTNYTRVADPSTIQRGSAVDIARAIARNLPAELASGDGPHVGTAVFNDVSEAIEALAVHVDESGGTIRATGAPTTEVTGTFPSSNGPEMATVRVEMFDGFLAPAFLGAHSDGDGYRREVARVGSWLVIVTIDGTVSEGSTALDAMSAVSDALNQTFKPDLSEPASAPSTLVAND